MTDLFEADRQIPERLRRLRRERGITLATLAEQVTVSATHLSRLEKGERQPSVGLLMQLARAYGLTLSQLVGDEPETAYQVIRGADVPVLQAPQLRYSSMAGFAGMFDVVRVEVDPVSQTPAVRHPGEEWLYVMSGRATLHLGEEAIELSTGDAAHFDSGSLHRIGNESKKVTRLLLVSVSTDNRPVSSTEVAVSRNHRL